MAKKPVSVLVHKKQPTKHIAKRRKLKPALQKIFNYMKSNNYMFAPLIHPQSSPPLSSAGEVSLKPMKKKEKTLGEEIYDYLKCDAYMYAPLATDSAFDGTASQPLGDQCCVCDQMETRGDEHTLNAERGARHNPMRRIVVEQSLLQKDGVRHIVHQNCLSLAATGEGLSAKKSSA